MKLSSALLAVAGVSADYACCQYNDYGVVDTSCPFSERTAWGDADAQVGLTQNECKAWEANTDATVDGSSSTAPYNWGGCGFQRLFPWDGSGAANGANTNWAKIELGGTDIITASNGPYGKVALNGICSLFIPVVHEQIGYVSVAGVHVKGGGYSTTANSSPANCGQTIGCSVFDAVLTDDATNTISGTSYVFAVSNEYEAARNTNNIVNSNVAGGTGALNSGFAYAQVLNDGSAAETNAAEWADGEVWDTGNSPEDTTENNSDDIGPNFDVVVHLKSTWCQSHWAVVDMQDSHNVGGATFTEHGHGATDYEVGSSSLTDWPGSNAAFTHAHHDAMDKRFSANECGAGASGLFGGPGTICSGTDTNLFAQAATADHKWPNAGAWAGAYSHIYCTSTGTDDTAHQIYNTGLTGTALTRVHVLSNFNNDFRRKDEAAQNVVVRGNIRQVGSQVQYCSPSFLPTAGSNRCTWNWNFDNAHITNAAFNNPTFQATGGTRTLDAISWSGIAVTNVNLEVCLGHGNAQVKATPHAESNRYNGITAAGAAWSIDWNGLGSSVTPSGTDFNCADIVLACDNAGGSNTAALDDYPICFQGDELHFQATLGSAVVGAGTWEELSYISAWYSTVA